MNSCCIFWWPRKGLIFAASYFLKHTNFTTFAHRQTYTRKLKNTLYQTDKLVEDLSETPGGPACQNNRPQPTVAVRQTFLSLVWPNPDVESYCFSTSFQLLHQPIRSARATKKHKRTLTANSVRSTFQQKSWASEGRSRAWYIFIDFSLHKIASPSTFISGFYRTSFTRSFKLCPRDLKYLLVTII